MRKQFFKTILIGCGILCLTATSVLASGIIARSALANEAAPDFTLADVNGGTATLKGSLGKGAILFFFTTWCPHCQDKIPMLAREYQAIKDADFRLYVINAGESEAKVKSYARKNNVPFGILLDSDMEASKAFGVMGVPSFFLIDQDGWIIFEGHELPGNYKALLSK
jgi:peroxiredoxin